MKITVANTSGFCFGVKRAIRIAKKEAKKHTEVLMLKDLVHNEEVIKDLSKLGIRKIKNLSKLDNKKTLLLCAHGEPKNIIDEAKNYGYRIVDATCPMVKHIHNIAKNIEKQNRTVIIIGDRRHAEVIGILGQINKKAIVVDPSKKLNLERLKKIKSASIIVQSTQELDTVLKIKDILSKYISDLQFFNTICKPTQARQEDVKKIAKENEVVIVIGSKNSANTKRLYQISKKINKNTYWINNESELKNSWFKRINYVGVTAGASTPQSTIKKVLKKIREFS
ncbi:MAG: 4-hydroxy-3-methylbut-2-enyl diphosphate reductase [Candidatus Omnitrophica bacterium]|nr:4-hydroxy-3-methylbut-2-enyl diphosphate reductase [Candidatus Omnitrophota bacterium]